MAEHIYMFSGSSVPVRVLKEESMMNEVIDRLGKDLSIRKTDVPGQMEVRFNCKEDSMIYRALQYRLYVGVLKPKNLSERIKKAKKLFVKWIKYKGNC